MKNLLVILTIWALSDSVRSTTRVSAALEESSGALLRGLDGSLPQIQDSRELQEDDPFHQVACGNPIFRKKATGCFNEDGKFYEIKRAANEEKHEVRCCSETNDKPYFRNREKADYCDVYATSSLPGLTGEKKCHAEVTYSEAVAICALNDARLCTMEEVLEGCAKRTGCNFDNELIWTSTAACETEADCEAEAQIENYVGCFSGQNERAIKVGNNFSIRSCTDRCKAAGYAFSGLTKGSHCYCGDGRSKNFRRTEDEVCKRDCKVGLGKCGAKRATSVFRTGLPKTDEEYFETEYVGCFNGMKETPPNFSIDDFGTGYSIESCVRECTIRNYGLAFLNNGNSCSCGDVYLKKRSNKCNVPCTEGKGFCGGRKSNGYSVYKTCNAKKPVETQLKCSGSLGSWFGDPHFLTFDKLAYNCQGLGLFTVLECKDYLVQSLFKPRGVKGSRASVTDGVVAQFMSYPSVQVNFPQFESPLALLVRGTLPVHIFVGGVLQDFNNKTAIEVPGVPGLEISSRLNLVEIQFPDEGPSLRIRVGAGTGNVGVMSVYACVPTDFEETCNGLLGTANGAIDDDWMERDGSTIFPLPPKFKGEGGYEYCTTHWCVDSEDDSIYTLGGDQTFEDLYGCSYEYAGDIDTSDLPQEIVDQCEELEDGLIEACLEDEAEALLLGEEEDIIDDEIENEKEEGVARIVDIFEDTTPPSECLEDVKLLKKVGSGFQRWPIRILSQDTTSVTVQIVSPMVQDKDISEIFIRYPEQYYFDLTTCIQFSDVDIEFEEEITLQCSSHTKTALFSIFALDSCHYNLPKDNCTVPVCCHPDEEIVEQPGVEYVFQVACESRCEEMSS